MRQGNMEEKLLLQQITYLSRLIGQHKQCNQLGSANLYDNQSQKHKQKPVLNHSVKSFNSNHTHKRVTNVVQSSVYKRNVGHPFSAPEPTIADVSKYNKSSNIQNNGRPILVSECPKKKNVVIPLHPSMNADLSVVSEIETEKALKSDNSLVTPSDCKFQTIETTEASKPSNKNPTNSKLQPHFNISYSVQNHKPNVEVRGRCVEKVTCVHINPQFLDKKDLCSFEGRTSSHQSVPNASVVHINPKLFAHILKSGESNALDTTEAVAGKSPHQSVGNKLQSLSMHLSKVNEVSVTKEQSRQNHVFCSKRKLVNEVPIVEVQSQQNHVFCNQRKLISNVRQNSPKVILLPTKKIAVVSNKIPSSCTSQIQGKEPQNDTLMAVSRTKLVRIPSRLRRVVGYKLTHTKETKSEITSYSPINSFAPSQPTRRNILRTKYLLTSKTQRLSSNLKLTSSVKMAKLVCSKYRLRNLPTSANSKLRNPIPANKTVSCSRTKYKIDRRHPKLRQVKNVKKYSLKYENVKPGIVTSRTSSKNKGVLCVPVNRFISTNKTWSSTGFSKPRKIVISHRKLSRIGNSTDPRERKTEQSSALVRIGGVLYKTSRTKLTRSKFATASTSQRKLRTSPTIIKKRKCNTGHVVYVRGNKFVMDPLGKTLRRIQNDAPVKSTLVKRIDIGGVTFVQKSSDLLMRTNNHNTRSILSQAKQRSIALLTKKMRKNNQPCLIYHRFGKCNRHEKGSCQLVHDPKHIAICKKFLQGKCRITGCLLSHNVVPEKMPTCKYFLEGCCVRDKCPYLHVKVSAKAAICLKFLQGYCSDGPKCKKRHVHLCPEFDQKGICHKGKYCPYPHKSGAKREKASKVVKETCKKPANKEQEQECKKRYYQNDNGKKIISVNSSEELKTVESIDSISYSTQYIDNSEDSDDEPRMKQRKLGSLPSYIAID